MIFLYILAFWVLVIGTGVAVYWLPEWSDVIRDLSMAGCICWFGAVVFHMYKRGKR
jgi:hypothetical protein